MNARPVRHGTITAYTHHKCRCDACRETATEMANRRRKQNPEKHREASRAHRERNLEQLREKDRLHKQQKYAENPGHVLEINRKNYRKYREHAVERQRKYYHATRDQQNERDRARNQVGADLPGNRTGQRWTESETVVALDTEITVVEKAFILRRSVGSIRSHIQAARKKAMA